MHEKACLEFILEFPSTQLGSRQVLVNDVTKFWQTTKTKLFYFASTVIINLMTRNFISTFICLRKIHILSLAFLSNIKAFWAGKRIGN